MTSDELSREWSRFWRLGDGEVRWRLLEMIEWPRLMDEFRGSQPGSQLESQYGSQA